MDDSWVSDISKGQGSEAAGDECSVDSHDSDLLDGVLRENERYRIEAELLRARLAEVTSGDEARLPRFWFVRRLPTIQKTVVVVARQMDTVIDMGRVRVERLLGAARQRDAGAKSSCI